MPVPTCPTCNFIDSSTTQTFDLTIDPSTSGSTQNHVCTTASLPISAASSQSGCAQSSSQPTSQQLTDASASIQCLRSIPTSIMQETYEDQIGIYGALIHFAKEKQGEATQYHNLWYGYHHTCYVRERRGLFGICIWCCGNNPETCHVSRANLIMYAVQTENIKLLWDDFVLELETQQATMLENMGSYNLNQTMQAEFTSLLAQVNEQIATSNLVIQQSELQLLSLKKEELKMKASYIIAPLLLVIGIALVFNKSK